MNLMQLLEFLNADWAEKERQRRLRKMQTPDDRYMDGSKDIPAGGWNKAVPNMRNLYTGPSTSPEPGFGILGPIAPALPEKRKSRRQDI
jgi:hypothetical protein